MAWLRTIVLLACIGAGLLALLPSTPAPAFDVGGSAKFLIVQVVPTADLVQSGGTLTIDVLVTDQHNVPVRGATVILFSDRGSGSERTLFTGADGRVTFTYRAPVADGPDGIRVAAMAAGYGSDALSEYRLEVLVLPPPPARTVEPAPAVGVSLGAVIAIAVVSTEAGRLGLFNLVLFPLYSRLRREEVLDHFVRGQIYGYIQSHPGEHYNKMREDLRITNGTLSHHLRTLEMQGFVKSRRDGIFRRFYPEEMNIPQDQGTRLSDLQIRLLAHLRRSGEGYSQSDLAVTLGVSQQTISYNLRVLSRHGHVRTVRAGRQRRYFVLDGLDA